LNPHDVGNRPHAAPARERCGITSISAGVVRIVGPTAYSLLPRVAMAKSENLADEPEEDPQYLPERFSSWTDELHPPAAVRNRAGAVDAVSM
jgi:hypothetical protein